MTIDKDYGFYEDPADGLGITRAKTLKLVRSWSIPRETFSLEGFTHEELRDVEFPAVYLLFEGPKKVYVGEATSISKRISEHNKSPDSKIREWQNVLIISDGRMSGQSDFSEEAIRKELEMYLIDLLKANKYNVVSQGQSVSLNGFQKLYVSAFVAELNFFLTRRNIISKLVEDRKEREVYSDELQRLIGEKRIKRFTEKNALVDGEEVFIRPGSQKAKGWQVTIRGGGKGSFIDALRGSRGYLLLARGDAFMIPLKLIRNLLTEKDVRRDTVDVFFRFDEGDVVLLYKQHSINVSSYSLRK